MSKKNQINVGIIGLGTVGSGAAEILLKKSTLLHKRTGCELILKKVADRSFKNAKSIALPQKLKARSWREIVEDPDIQIVVELMGGLEIAKDVVLSALKNGKHVVTANKALLAVHGKEIYSLAAKQNLNVCFEASVGGGIPILRALREGYAANEIKSLFGIINGTCNYILSEMTEKGADFASILKQAQTLGYAEKDPGFDVDGIDAAHKLSILISIAYGVNVPFKDIYVEGIRKITPLDIECGKKFNYILKLLAIAKKRKDKIEARVHPCLIPISNPLASVKDAFNAVLLEGDYVGTGLLYGRGAGRNPTASAVIGDVIEIARQLNRGNKVSVSPLSYLPHEIKTASIQKIEDLKSEYYLRFTALDVPGVMAKISSLLSRHKISISSVYQHVQDEGRAVPIVIFTHEVKEKDLQKALKEISRLQVILEKPFLIRVEK